MRDLASTSPLMQELAKARLPFGIQMTAIGGTTDFLVPADASNRPGVQHATETPGSLNAHTGILTDPATLQDVRAALEDKPLPCRSLVHHIAGEVVPAAISGVEARGGKLMSGGLVMGVQP